MPVRVRVRGSVISIVGAIVISIALATGCRGGATAAPPGPARVHPWPMFRGDPVHRGDRSGRETPAWQVAWTTELGARIDASPLVTDAGVVVATRTGAVVVLDPVGGAERARVELGGAVWATPAAAGDVIVVAVRHGRRGELVGVGVDRLDVRWRRPVASGVFGAATVDDGRVWLCAGTDLVAVDPAGGDVAVQVALGDRCYGAPLAVDGVITVATRDGRVRGFDRRGAPTGWQALTSDGADNDVAPVAAGDLILVGSNDRYLHAFDRDGHERWRAGGNDWVVSSPAVAGELAVFGDDGGVIRAVALADGSERWRGQVGDDSASSPVVVGGLAIHGAHDGELHAWQLADGVEREPIDGGGKMFASPAVTGDGLVVIATQRGRVFAVR